MSNNITASPQTVDVQNLVGTDSAVTDLRMREKNVLCGFFYHGLRGVGTTREDYLVVFIVVLNLAGIAAVLSII